MPLLPGCAVHLCHMTAFVRSAFNVALLTSAIWLHLSELCLMLHFSPLPYDCICQNRAFVRTVFNTFLCWLHILLWLQCIPRVTQTQLITSYQTQFIILLWEYKVCYALLIETNIPTDSNVVFTLRLFHHLVIIYLQNSCIINAPKFNFFHCYVGITDCRCVGMAWLWYGVPLT